MNKKIKDLTGQKFGKLTVVEFYGIDKYRRANWLCKCECGNTKVVDGGSLKSGGVRSCGCIKKGTGKRREDLTGQKFGNLTVVEFIEIRYGHAYYKCKCDCGNEKIIDGYSLKRGVTRSCGCIKKENKKTRKNKGGLYSYQAKDVELKNNTNSKKIKEYKLSKEELAKYLEDLKTKEVQYVGGIK